MTPSRVVPEECREHAGGSEKGRSRSCVATLSVVLVGLATAISAFGGEATTAVRIPAEAEARLAGAALEGVRSFDYGAFRWLELSPRELRLLEESGVPFSVVEDAGVLSVPNYRFDPLVEGPPRLSADQRSTDAGPGFRLVQLVAPPRDAWLAELEAFGLRLVQYYPHHTYLVWADALSLDHAASRDFVRWRGTFHPAYKIGPGLVGRSGRISNVDVTFFDDGHPEETLGALEELGGVVLDTFPAQPDRLLRDAIVELPADAIGEVARIPTVLSLAAIGPRPELNDEVSAQIVAGNVENEVLPVPGYPAWLGNLGYDGSGITWAVVDTGVDWDHSDLASRVVGGSDFDGACQETGEPGSDCPGFEGGHGTHVAGILAGDATAALVDSNGFYYGLGVAPGASLFAMNSISGDHWPPLGGWEEHSKRAVLAGATGANNSWRIGDQLPGHGYHSAERTHDFIVRDGNFDTTETAEPLIEVFAGGNESLRGITPPSEAKNLIVVASSGNFRFGERIDGISVFSSWGPAADGRWVPTVAAPGKVVTSARNTSGGDACDATIDGTSDVYSYCSGTSMAAPQASGALAIMAEWWLDRQDGPFPLRLSPAMARALLVNGAVDMAAPDVPNYLEGWGRIHLGQVVREDVDRIYRDQRFADRFDQTGESVRLDVGVPDRSEPLKVTLAWSDAPGAIGADPALVNDLDLTVTTDELGYLGNEFRDGWSLAGGRAWDRLNNLENVFVENPGREATIEIDAALLAGDGIPYDGDATDQDFALVCHNCTLDSTFDLVVSPSELALCLPDPGTVQVEVGSILGERDPVTLEARDLPAGIIASFETNPVVPGGSTPLTLEGSRDPETGAWAVTVAGSDGGTMREAELSLHVADATPPVASLSIPADGSTVTSTRPRFEWTPVDGAERYVLEIATDPSFDDLLYSTTVRSPSHVPTIRLVSGAAHSWRVRALNGCGESVSSVFRFTTPSAPGACPSGMRTERLSTSTFEGQRVEWTHEAALGRDTWRRTNVERSGGEFSFRVHAASGPTDQRLVSPEVVLPQDSSGVTLRFWNRRDITTSLDDCHSGAVVEISSDGGTWTRLEAELLGDPYDAPVTAPDNPLVGEDVWCGESVGWKETVVDLGAWAGHSVRLRFRMGTPDYIFSEWLIDDVAIDRCVEEGLIFADGFESGDTGAWSSQMGQPTAEEAVGIGSPTGR